ncbi:hypothetical protein BJ165DRAFT_1516163 [Panaeolus papilionaceus]|nr:hypothetical protein BJ165DRAFT_1516163 [Panaeolus papilionaceus]
MSSDLVPVSHNAVIGRRRPPEVLPASSSEGSGIEKPFVRIHEYLLPILEEKPLGDSDLGQDHWFQDFRSHSLSIRRCLSRSIELSYLAYGSLSDWLEYFTAPATAPLAETCNQRDNADALQDVMLSLRRGLLADLKSMQMILAIAGGERRDGSLDTVHMCALLQEEISIRLGSQTRAVDLTNLLTRAVQEFDSFTLDVKHLLSFWVARANAISRLFDNDSFIHESLSKKQKRIQALKRQQNLILDYIFELRPFLQTRLAGFGDALSWIERLGQLGNSGGFRRLSDKPAQEHLTISDDAYNKWGVYLVRDSSTLISRSITHSRADFISMAVHANIFEVIRIKHNTYSIKAIISSQHLPNELRSSCRCVLMSIVWTFSYPPGNYGSPVIQDFEPAAEHTHHSSAAYTIEASATFGPTVLETRVGDVSYSKSKKHTVYSQGKIVGLAHKPDSTTNSAPDRVRWTISENSSTKSDIDSCRVGVVLDVDETVHAVTAEMTIIAKYKASWQDVHCWAVRHSDSCEMKASGARLIDFPLFMAIEDFNFKKILDGCHYPLNANRPRLHR